MRADGRTFLDLAIDHGVAALFALASAYPALLLFAAWGPSGLALAGLVAVLAFALAWSLLRRMGQGATLAPPRFVPLPLPKPVELEPLLLGIADRHDEANSGPFGELRAALTSDGRVVPLFADSERRTPGELAAKIDRHCGRGAAERDDSGALVAALDQLRRTLR